MSTVIDLRSDTLTCPSPAMRAAMAQAAVGDDVYGEDPTVNTLQQRVAELTGFEAGLFLPSGTMGNQLALLVHCQRGEEVIVGANSHSWLFETGAAAAIAGVQHCVIPGDGRFTAADVHANIKPDDHHHARTSAVVVENTHNMGGGLVWQKGALDGVTEACRTLGLRVHLDGARLWNAAVASGRSERELCTGFDTATVCLSKGLGAPVGSVLCGDRDTIHRAHRFRKMLGGGMRQVGILAAAGIYALDHMRNRLADDHDNALAISNVLAEAAGTGGLDVDGSRVHTNIVIAQVSDAEALANACKSRGVMIHALGKSRVRLVTHLHLSREQCERAAAVVVECATSL